MATTTPRKRAAKKAPAKAPARRAGRPSALQRVVMVEDGRNVTAAEVVVRRLAAGAYREEAALSAGLAKQTFYNWLYRGAQARRTIATGGKVNAEERSYAQFLDQVDAAEAAAEANAWDTLGRLAQGGLPQQTVREKLEVRRNPDGTPMLDENNQPMMVVVERVRTVSQTLPSVQALTWRMERRWPERYGPRRAQELPEPEANPEDMGARAAQLADGIEAYLQGVADTMGQ